MKPPPTPRAASVLAIVLTLAATYFLLGDTGRFNDDYFYNLRDPVTGDVHSLVLDKAFHVWRPLLKIVTPPLQTLLVHHLWALHALCTILHLLVGWLLFRLLVRLGISQRIAAASTIVFLVYPAHFEAVLWASCIPTLLGSAILLGMAHWHLSWIGQPHVKPGPIKGMLPLAFGACAFAVAALNEQPAGPIAALPMLGLLVPLDSPDHRWTRIRRSIVPVAFAGIALIGYLKGHFAHVAHSKIRESEFMLTNRVLGNIADILSSLPRELALSDWARPALSIAKSTLIGHPWLAAMFSIAILASAAWAWLWWIRPDAVETAVNPQSSPSLADRPGHLLGICACALAWWIGAWIPIVVIHGQALSRLFYVPNLALAMLIAALLQACTPRVPHGQGTPAFQRVQRFARLLAFCAVLTLSVYFTLVMIGTQRAYQLRSRQDLQEMAALRSLVGDDLPPGTILLPVMVHSRAVRTGSDRFDRFFAGCWNWEYASGWLLQETFRRKDVHIALSGLDTPLELYAIPDSATRAGAPSFDTCALFIGRPARPLSDSKPRKNPLGKGRFLPYDSIIPFNISAEGEISLYTHFEIERPTPTPPLVMTPPLVQRILARTNCPEKILRLPLAPDAFFTKSPLTDTSPETDDAPHIR